jgi:hypothetical protein
MKRNKLDQIKITKWAKIWTNITLRAQYQPVLRGSFSMRLRASLNYLTRVNNQHITSQHITLAYY